jgi:hypothetical protein
LEIMRTLKQLFQRSAAFFYKMCAPIPICRNNLILGPNSTQLMTLFKKTRNKQFVNITFKWATHQDTCIDRSHYRIRRFPQSQSLYKWECTPSISVFLNNFVMSPAMLALKYRFYPTCFGVLPHQYICHKRSPALLRVTPRHYLFSCFGLNP